jgi:hypothetical protein
MPRSCGHTRTVSRLRELSLREVFDCMVSRSCHLDKETSSIRLVHKSLFEYLKKQHETGQLFKHGHSEIVRTCLIYMNFDNDKTKLDPTLPREMFRELFREEIDKHTQEFCLIRYAIQNWGWHSKKYESKVVTDLAVNLFLRPFDSICISHGLYHSSVSEDYFYPVWEEQTTYKETQQSLDTIF